MRMVKGGEERRGKRREGEERSGPGDENESKVNMKDETGTGERAEFRSSGEGGERNRETEEVDGEMKEREKQGRNWTINEAKESNECDRDRKPETELIHMQNAGSSVEECPAVRLEGPPLR